MNFQFLFLEKYLLCFKAVRPSLSLEEHIYLTARIIFEQRDRYLVEDNKIRLKYSSEDDSVRIWLVNFDPVPNDVKTYLAEKYQLPREQLKQDTIQLVFCYQQGNVTELHIGVWIDYLLSNMTEVSPSVKAYGIIKDHEHFV